MIDITPQLEAFRASCSGWAPSRSKELADKIARLCTGSFDWDEDAGEDWSRILKRGRVSALIYMNGPLVILVGIQSAEVRRLTQELPVISVPSLGEVVLSSDPQTLRAVFGDQVWNNPALDPASFSAGELWFCTV